MLSLFRDYQSPSLKLFYGEKIPSLNILRLCQGSQLPAKLLLEVAFEFDVLYQLSSPTGFQSNEEKLGFLFFFCLLTYKECFFV